MAEPPDPDDMRRAMFHAHRWAVRSLLQTLLVDRCFSRDDPIAAAKELLARERDAMDGIPAPAVGSVDSEMVKHLVLDEIETLLQSVAREVEQRVEKKRRPS